MTKPIIFTDSKQGILKGIFILSFIIFGLSFNVEAQQKDSIASSIINPSDTFTKTTTNPLVKILNNNFSIHVDSKSISSPQIKRLKKSDDRLFYQLVMLLIFLGILKTTFSKYFINLIRVFFNTSLRQTQLTDQLLLARLPSLLFNVFFILSAGYYLFILLTHNHQKKYGPEILFLCFALVLMTYIIKTLGLKLTGWITGFKKETDEYVFNVFLVNKILGFLLVPFLIIIPFAEVKLADVAVVVSYFTIGFLFIFRYLRSYEMLHYRLKASRLHFMLYIFGIELLPLLIIYRLVMIFVNKNL